MSVDKESGEELSQEKQDDIRSFADRLVREMKNYKSTLEGKDKAVRFDARVMRSAMEVFLKSKSNYKAYKKNCPWILPSASRLQQLKAGLTVDDGEFPKLYGWLFDRRGHFDIREDRGELC
jgi:hypothetical protein